MVCRANQATSKIAKLNGGNTVVTEPCMALIMQHIEIGFVARTPGQSHRDLT